MSRWRERKIVATSTMMWERRTWWCQNTPRTDNIDFGFFSFVRTWISCVERPTIDFARKIFPRGQSKSTKMESGSGRKKRKKNLAFVTFLFVVFQGKKRGFSIFLLATLHFLFSSSCFDPGHKVAFLLSWLFFCFPPASTTIMLLPPYLWPLPFPKPSKPPFIPPLSWDIPLLETFSGECIPPFSFPAIFDAYFQLFPEKKSIQINYCPIQSLPVPHCTDTTSFRDSLSYCYLRNPNCELRHHHALSNVPFFCRRRIPKFGHTRTSYSRMKRGVSASHYFYVKRGERRASSRLGFDADFGNGMFIDINSAFFCSSKCKVSFYKRQKRLFICGNPTFAVVSFTSLLLLFCPWLSWSRSILGGDSVFAVVVVGGKNPPVATN